MAGTSDTITLPRAEWEKTQDFIKKAAPIVEAASRTPADGQRPTLWATPRDPKLTKQAGFEHERDFYLAVIKASMGEEMDSRLRPLYRKSLDLMGKTVGSDEGAAISNPYGGFLVPPGFLPEFLTIAPEADPIGASTRKIPMAVPTVSIPARVDQNHTSSVSGGVTVTRRPETVAGTASRMEISEVTLVAKELYGLSYASETLLRYSAVSFAAILAAGFNDQFQYALLKERLYGTGVGEYLGALNTTNPSLISVSAESGQAADTIVYDNVLKMYARCWGYDRAIWLTNHDCMPQLMKLNQTVGVGGMPVWQPSAREGEPPTLLGRPIVRSEYAKKLGDAGDISLCNWTEYLEGSLQGMQSDESIHVRFTNNERAFRWYVMNAGQPWWKAALTPINSNDSMSPFVTLAAR